MSSKLKSTSPQAAGVDIWLILSYQHCTLCAIGAPHGGDFGQRKWWDSSRVTSRLSALIIYQIVLEDCKQWNSKVFCLTLTYLKICLNFIYSQGSHEIKESNSKVPLSVLPESFCQRTGKGGQGHWSWHHGVRVYPPVYPWLLIIR